jgi:cellulose synthase/poly-beta-1,6-N-acetylglucosamine synthase-like glycosyltransferase
VLVVAADEGGGKAAGLNAAVQAARGDVLVFSDATQRFAPDAIGILVRRLQADARLAAVGGALQLPGDRPGAGRRSPVEWYWVFERRLRNAEARLHSSVGLSGSIYALWRSCWVPMPLQLILDDVWLPMRQVLAGRRVGYDLTAVAWDARSTTASVEKVRKVRTLTGNFQLMAWLPAVLVPIRNPIWLQFLSHKLFRLFTPWLLLISAASFAVAAAQLLPWAQVRTILLGLTMMAAAILAIRPTRAVVLRGAQWWWSLQSAIVEATMNGLRGQWNVWR